MRTDYRPARIAYRVTVKNRPDIPTALVYVQPGIKTPWNDARAEAFKEIRTHNEDVKYIDLRATQYPAAHLYEFPGRHKPLTSREIEEELSAKNGISQFPEEFEEIVKNTPTDYQEEDVITRANKVFLRVMFWVSIGATAAFWALGYFLEWF